MKSRLSIVTSLLASVLLTCAACSPRGDSCSAIDAIANDTTKMHYAREWIASHLADPKFRESVQRRHTFDFGDERISQFGMVDWKYLGFAKELASLRFNMATTNSGEWDISRIDSVSLQQGRVAIVIRLSSLESFQSFWPQEVLAKMHSVANDVLVYCDE